MKEVAGKFLLFIAH